MLRNLCRLSSNRFEFFNQSWVYSCLDFALKSMFDTKARTRISRLVFLNLNTFYNKETFLADHFPFSRPGNSLFWQRLICERLNTFFSKSGRIRWHFQYVKNIEKIQIFPLSQQQTALKCHHRNALLQFQFHLLAKLFWPITLKKWEVFSTVSHPFYVWNCFPKKK